MAGAGRPGPGGRSRGAVAGRSGGREAGARRPEPGGRGREVVAGGREAGSSEPECPRSGGTSAVESAGVAVFWQGVTRGRNAGAGMPEVRENFGGRVGRR